MQGSEPAGFWFPLPPTRPRKVTPPGAPWGLDFGARLRFRSQLRLSPGCVTWGRVTSPRLALLPAPTKGRQLSLSAEVVGTMQRGKAGVPHRCPHPPSLSLLLGELEPQSRSPLHSCSLAPAGPESAFNTHQSACAAPLSPEDTGSVVTATRVLPPTPFNNFSTAALGRLGEGERALG